MTSNKFKNFLKNLGFSENDFKEEPRDDVFVYKIPIDETQIEEVRYVHTPTDNEVFEEHQRSWNRSNVNSFVAVGNDKTYLIDAKVKPDKENPVNSKITIGKPFNYGVNSEGFEKEKLQIITKDAINATYFFDFVIKNRNKNPQEVDKDLLLNLIALRNDLLEIKNDEETIHLLILRCLFIKYLEDRKIYKKGHLTDALNSQNPAKLVEAFDEIKKINGDIFDRSISENEIDNAYLQKLSLFFTYDYLSGQGRLFPYLFDEIPIQLISNVYEAFLNNDKKQGKGIYYTPTFLVNFMLSHSLKEKLKEKQDITVFDPAVGSGAFLVESFKAIVKPNDSYEKKKDILQNQLFGVDVDQDALQIAAFSLYLALIETEKPEFIHKQIEISNPILPSLIGKTLIQANSITADVFKGKTFGCIVSNPPWGSAEPNGDEENIKERDAIEEKGKTGKIPEYKNVSDYERSQAFLIRVKKWSNENTILSLVVKNSIFLNDNSEGFRKEILKTYQINYFYELSNYNKILFKKRKIGDIKGKPIVIGASEPCAVLVFELPKTENNKLKYISPKLNDFSENFQIIHYTQKDINEVEQDRFIEDDLIWKVLISGDFEDYKLLRKIESQKSTFSIICSKGFERQKTDEIGAPKIRKMIQSEDFDRYFIHNSLTEFNWNQTLRRPGNENLFSGERILIANRPRPTDNFKLRGILVNEEIIFRNDLVGFKAIAFSSHYPFLAIINSSLIGYYMFQSSAQWFGGSKRDYIRVNDIKNLPFKINDYFAEKSENLLKNITRENADIIEAKFDELVFNLYGLKEYEKEIIREFYQVKVERAGKNEKFVRKSDIEKYTNKFSEVFGLMLEEDSKLVATKYHFAVSINLGAAICFTIVNKNDETQLKEDNTLEILNFVKKKQIEKTDIKKILNEEKVKIYDDKFLYIVKSNLFKDWTIRQAIKDANEEVGLLLSKLPTG